MATNIGTQAASLIEKATQTSLALECMGRLSHHISMSHADAHDWWYPIEVLTELHNTRFSELTHYLEREVLPLVAHIQKAGK